ncbi:MAG: hypothetical protein IPN13_22395 [Bacteroidetes bacterium]|nr:hypothetical protein [Bacteroidota bacterium]
MRKFLILKSLCLTSFLTIPFAAISQNVGIGTATPLEKLHVIGNIRSSTLAGVGNRIVLADPNGTLITATGAGSPAWMTTGNSLTNITTDFINNIAPFATSQFSSYSTLTFDAVVGAATGTGDGVYGQNTSTGATPGSGVTGISTSSTGFGVFAYNTNAAGTGIIAAGNNVPAGYAAAGSGGAFTGTRIGIYSVSNNINAALSSSGVMGRDAGGTFTMLNGGAGVTGSAANSGVGIFAYNTGTTNFSHGIYSNVFSNLPYPYWE